MLILTSNYTRALQQEKIFTHLAVVDVGPAVTPRRHGPLQPSSLTVVPAAPAPLAHSRLCLLMMAFVCQQDFYSISTSVALVLFYIQQLYILFIHLQLPYSFKNPFK
jgi:hypothetical protein